ncbi:MAG: nucleoside phosphorylase [Candidatus Thorarchaeota archaeon]|nr:nucleoside phosphorylase [Candidatus Thorarchaeota archaeon]
MKRRVQPHLRVGEGDVERITLITGNPDRVPLITSQMRDVEEVARYRGLVTHHAFTPKGVPVTVSGTGMGAASTHICVEELARLGAQVFIRVGSCGGIDPSVKTGDVVIPTGCVRDERASLNYAPSQYPAVASIRWQTALHRETRQLLPPARVHTGLCWTSDVYYVGPENRQLDLWTRARVKCVEMESSLLFVFASTKGLEAASILTCDGNLHTGQKAEQSDESEKSGEQDPLFDEAIAKSVTATIRAIDSEDHL